MQNLNEKTFNLLESTGLNWTVTKESLFAKDGKSTESFGIFRNDNSHWLGTVGNRYETFQNSEMAEMVLQAADGLQLDVTRGGLLYDGSKTYLQLDMPEEFVGKSIVKRWLTCLNSHDGSTSIGFGSANTTVVCQNTFFRAYGEIEKIRHTASAKERIETMIRDMRAAMNLDIKMMESFKRMADLPLVESLFAKLTSKLFNIEVYDKPADLSTRKNNQMQEFGNAVEKSVLEQGSTIWALFNGITRYTNHIAAPKKEDTKQNYLMANGGAQFANTGFDEIMKYVAANTNEYIAV